MLVIEAVNEVYSLENEHNLKVFLAGGITNCPDWQKDIIEMLKELDLENLTVYNPRRKKFPIKDPDAAEQQIAWEYKHLESADIIVFWFSRGSLNPIVLYELGKWGNSEGRHIIIGIDPGYERAQDVRIQTALARPEVRIFNNLEDVASAISRAMENYNESNNSGE
jgi:hypothetical protein